MKIHAYLITIIITSLFIACGTTRSAAEKEEIAANVEKAVKGPAFKFKATYVFPTGFRSQHLSPYYEVDVSPDTVKVYLPYYGRAYKAPISPSEGGYRFTSTDFDYSLEQGNRSGNWLVKIDFNDLARSVTYNLDVWENETARLSITDTDRQSISFQGDFETKDLEGD